MTARAITLDADTAVIIGEFEKNRRETVRVSLKEFKGIPLADVRVFYTDEDGELRPTGKGISIRPAQLPRLLEILQQAETEARRRGLL